MFYVALKRLRRDRNVHAYNVPRVGREALLHRRLGRCKHKNANREDEEREELETGEAGDRRLDRVVDEPIDLLVVRFYFKSMSKRAKASEEGKQ